MGVTVNSPKEIFIGAPGTVKFRTVDLGATTGGITVRVRPTIFTPQLNGIPGMLAMTDYLQTEEVEVELSLAELSQATLLAVLAGSSLSGSTITRTGNRRYPSTMYGAFQIIWQGLDTNTLQFDMAMATCISGLEITASDDSAAAPTVIFAGRVDPANPTKSIWSFTRGLPVFRATSADGEGESSAVPEGEDVDVTDAVEAPAPEGEIVVDPTVQAPPAEPVPAPAPAPVPTPPAQAVPAGVINRRKAAPVQPSIQA
jgi:hypothetical protein